MKKYELTEESKQYLGKTLYRIKALKDFGSIKKGELGGWLESESNLSQDGNTMVSGDALVYGDALVFGNAMVSDNARVSDNATVYGNARVYGDARVSDNARVTGNAWVYGDATIRGYDEIDNSNQHFNILGFEYPITVTYSSIHVGCKDYAIDQLDTVFDDEEYSDNEDIKPIKMMITLALDRILRKIEEEA